MKAAVVHLLLVLLWVVAEVDCFEKEFQGAHSNPMDKQSTLAARSDLRKSVALASRFFRENDEDGILAVLSHCTEHTLIGVPSVSGCRAATGTVFMLQAGERGSLDVQHHFAILLRLRLESLQQSQGQPKNRHPIVSVNRRLSEPLNYSTAANHTLQRSSQTPSHSTHGGAELSVLYPFVALWMGVMCATGILSWIPLPYTSLLLVFGGLFGALKASVNLGDLALSADMMENMDPHLLLFIFLPPLIFESAFSIEWHMFVKTAPQVLMLAGPGLLIAAALTAAGSKLWLYPGWSWETGLLFGTILSATDPVAVVALLKELGAKKSLSTLIEGESLMNDGTAVVVFTVLLKAVGQGGMSDGPLTVAWVFVKMAAGGCLFGLLMGVVTVEWIGRVFNNPNVEVTLSLSSAYLTFFIAEHFLRVSGVLAVVVLGIYFSYLGRTRTSPEVEEFLHEFFEVMAFIANSLIFLLTGLIIFSRAFHGGSSLVALEFMRLLAVYAIIHAARAAAFGLLFPVLRLQGYGLSWREGVACVWGGLRGAVGLALALVASLDEDVPQEVGQGILFHTAGVVMLTLLLNASTMSSLVSALGIDRVRMSQELLFRHAMRELHERGLREEGLLKTDPLYSCAHWAKVRGYKFQVSRVHLLQDEDEEEEEEELMPTPRGGAAGAAAAGAAGAARLMRGGGRRAAKYTADTASGMRAHIRHRLRHCRRALKRGVRRLCRRCCCCLRSKRRRLHPGRSQRLSLKLQFAEMPEAMREEEGLPSPSRSRVGSTHGPGGGNGGTAGGGGTSGEGRAMVATHNSSTAPPAGGGAGDLEVGVEDSSQGDGLEERLLESRRRFLVSLKASYWKQFREGMLGRQAVRLLMAATDHALDNDCCMEEWEELRRVLEPCFTSHAAHFFSAIPGLGRVARNYLFSRLQKGYDVASSFLLAREEGLLLLRHLLHDEPDVLAVLQPHATAEMAKAKQALYHIQRSVPEVAASITTVAAARRVLNAQRRVVGELQEEGFLDDAETRRVTIAIETQLKQLLYHPPSVQLPSKESLLREIPWIGSLSAPLFAAVVKEAVEAVFQKSDVLIQQGKRHHQIHVIARGTVVVVQEGEGEQEGQETEIAELGVGSFLGELGLLTNEAAKCSVRATSPVISFALGYKILRQIFMVEGAFQHIWKSAGSRIAERLLAAHPPYSSWNKRALHRWIIRHWVLLTPADLIDVARTAHDGDKALALPDEGEGGGEGQGQGQGQATAPASNAAAGAGGGGGAVALAARGRRNSRRRRVSFDGRQQPISVTVPPPLQRRGSQQRVSAGNGVTIPALSVAGGGGGGGSGSGGGGEGKSEADGDGEERWSPHTAASPLPGSVAEESMSGEEGEEEEEEEGADVFNNSAAPSLRRGSSYRAAIGGNTSGSSGSSGTSGSSSVSALSPAPLRVSLRAPPPLLVTTDDDEFSPVGELPTIKGRGGRGGGGRSGGPKTGAVYNTVPSPLPVRLPTALSSAPADAPHNVIVFNSGSGGSSGGGGSGGGSSSGGADPNRVVPFSAPDPVQQQQAQPRSSSRSSSRSNSRSSMSRTASISAAATSFFHSLKSPSASASPAGFASPPAGGAKPLPRTPAHGALHGGGTTPPAGTATAAAAAAATAAGGGSSSNRARRRTLSLMPSGLMAVSALSTLRRGSVMPPLSPAMSAASGSGGGSGGGGGGSGGGGGGGDSDGDGDVGGALTAVFCFRKPVVLVMGTAEVIDHVSDGTTPRPDHGNAGGDGGGDGLYALGSGDGGGGGGGVGAGSSTRTPRADAATSIAMGSNGNGNSSGNGSGSGTGSGSASSPRRVQHPAVLAAAVASQYHYCTFSSDAQILAPPGALLYVELQEGAMDVLAATSRRRRGGGAGEGGCGRRCT